MSILNIIFLVSSILGIIAFFTIEKRRALVGITFFILVCIAFAIGIYVEKNRNDLSPNNSKRKQILDDNYTSYKIYGNVKNIIERHYNTEREYDNMENRDVNNLFSINLNNNRDYEFDSRGRLIEELNFDPNDTHNFRNRTKYLYSSPKGRLSNIQVFSKNGKLLSEEVISYDSNEDSKLEDNIESIHYYRGNSELRAVSKFGIIQEQNGYNSYEQYTSFYSGISQGSSIHDRRFNNKDQLLWERKDKGKMTNYSYDEKGLLKSKINGGEKYLYYFEKINHDSIMLVREEYYDDNDLGDFFTWAYNSECLLKKETKSRLYLNSEVRVIEYEYDDYSNVINEIRSSQEFAGSPKYWKRK